MLGARDRISNAMVKEGKQKDLYKINKEGVALVREAEKLQANTKKQEMEQELLERQKMYSIPATNDGSKSQDFIQKARLFDSKQTKLAMTKIQEQIDIAKSQEEHQFKTKLALEQEKAHKYQG